MVQDPDSICTIFILVCDSTRGFHHTDVESLTKKDSLTCSETSHYYLENNSKVLCVKRNLYGDTLEIGLKEEHFVKNRWKFFRRKRTNSDPSLFGEKTGEWYYYFPDGLLKEIKKY